MSWKDLYGIGEMKIGPKKRYAFLFPGQGSQYVGMGKDFYETYPIARETWQEADEILGFSLSKIAFEGPAETLTETQYSQTAIFVNSVAILRVLKSQLPDIIPVVCAGLSLGEYSALFASGRLSFSETLKLVRERARLMNEACLKTEGTMAAVLGLSSEIVDEVIASLKTDVWVANYNAPGQIVISGSNEGVEKADLALKEKGAKRVLPLQVHGAFHSGLMRSAEEGLKPFVEQAAIQDSPIELAMNVPGQLVRSIHEMKKNLTLQVTHSVRWDQAVRALDGMSISLFLEIGCGKTLTGLNRKIGVSAPTIFVDRVGDVDEVAKAVDAFAMK